MPPEHANAVGHGAQSSAHRVTGIIIPTVVGTLSLDLLLAWLGPPIRYT